MNFMKQVKKQVHPSEFRKLTGIEYFGFEEDFIEDNVRCIPMIVRFKMDAAGIKLKLAEWSRFAVNERIELAMKPCNTAEETSLYNQYLGERVKKYTGCEATVLAIDKNPEWQIADKIPGQVMERAESCNFIISVNEWERLTHLQRFALLKLCRQGHESKNFIVAMEEFGLTTGKTSMEGMQTV